MAAFGSLLAGVTGLNTNQQMLDIIGNNLANSNTTAYKSQSVSFEDLFYQTLQPATPSTQQAGGTDPIQVGFGTKLGTIASDMTQGTLQPTGNELDMGIQGSGYFVENDGTNTFYTRAGSFTVDSSGYLRDPTTGFNIERFGNVGEPSGSGPGFQVPGDNRIQIPYGTGNPGQITSNVTLQGNLDATAPGATSGSPTANVTLAGVLDSADATGATVSGSIQVYDSQGKAHTMGVSFVKDAQADTWDVTVSLPPGEGTVNQGSPFQMTFDPASGALTSSSTQALTLDFSASGASNSQPVTLSLSGLSEANAVSTAAATSQDGVAAVAGTTAPTAIQIFDSKGTGHTLTLTFTKTAANPSANPPVPESWSVSASVPATEGTVSGTLGPITFNTDGSPSSFGNTNLTFDFSKSGASGTQTVSFNLGSVGGFTGVTEFGGTSTAAATNQNGFASGTLQSVSIDKTGVIKGVFTNGKVIDLAQLAVASFANNEGLSRQGNNLYTATGQSGQAVLGAGASAGRGTVQQGVLEQSNVDVAAEFTQLIIAQRGYEVNARTVSVSDQVLQALTNIIQG
jgi:flagellar hook protein FlgE